MYGCVIFVLGEVESGVDYLFGWDVVVGLCYGVYEVVFVVGDDVVGEVV